MFRTILTLLFIQFSLIAIAQDEIFKVVEEMPRFEGCEAAELTRSERKKCSNEKLVDFVYTNLVISEVDKKNKTEGRAIVQFIVNLDGKISDVNIVRSVSETADQSILDMFKKMNEEKTWRPGHQRKRAVRVLYTLPILFRLENY